MKKTIIFALTFLLLMGCRHHRAVSPRLVELDSLIAVAPDSAAALLQAIPSDSLTDPENRAYHALLLTQARYKAYIPATSDSDINIAVDYFVAKKDGDYDRRIRSLIYKGCVMTELNHLDSAIYWLKRAEVAARPDDHANLGYILFRIAELYQYEYVASNLTMTYYQRALSHLKESGQSFYEMACLSELASLSCLADGHPDWRYMLPALMKSLSQNNMKYLSANLATLGSNKLYTNDYSMAIRLFSLVLDLPASVTTHSRCQLMLAQAYAATGNVDSAKKLLDKCTINSAIDSMLYYRASAMVDYASGDIASYYEHDNAADNIAGNKLIASEATKLKDTEDSYILQLSENEKQISSIRVRLIALAALAVIALIVFLTIIWQKRKKLEAVSKQNEINKLYLELKEISQRSESLSQQNKELSQENEELQALAKKVQQTESDLSTDKDYANLENERLKEKQLSKSLEYIAGLLHTFIQQSHELKPSEFMEKFRKGFLETPNGGEVDFWYTLRVQADQVHGGAVEKLLAEHPDLNEKSIRVLCMSALGFSTEMMATCLQHKSDYIKTLKNRLKKKLDINCSIPEYLKQLGETR